MKYGLALGCGGARGFAHLGALKVLDELEFKPDIISGTSIGAIVGALYSKGITPYEMFKLRKDFNIKQIMQINNPINGGITSLNGLKKTLRPYLDNLEFKDLKNKFMTAATNLQTGKGTILKKGLILDAVCASACVPGIFNPVKIENELYVDGSLSIPVPVKALRKEGAQKIISINLMHINPQIKTKEPLILLKRITNIMINNLSENQNENADVTINIPTYDYYTFSISKATELFKLGEKTTRGYIKEIKKLIN